MRNIGSGNTTTVTFIVVCMAVSLICLLMELTHFRNNTPHTPPREHHDYYWSSSAYQRTKVRIRLKKVENVGKTLDNSYDAPRIRNEVYESANEEVILNVFRSVTYRKPRSIWSARFNSGVQRKVSSSNKIASLSENDSLIQTRLQRSKSIILKHNNAYDQLIHLLTTFTARGIASNYLPFSPHPSGPSTSFISLKCSYVLPYSPSSSICKKSKRHCVVISDASEANQKLPVNYANTYSHTGEQNVYLSGYENPWSCGCRVVKESILGNDKPVMQVKPGNEALNGIDYPITCKESRKIRAPEEEDDGKWYTQMNLTIDSQRSFVHELGGLTEFPRCLALDLMFDLSGLNSLHRHEVISTLLQVILILVSALTPEKEK